MTELNSTGPSGSPTCRAREVLAAAIFLSTLVGCANRGMQAPRDGAQDFGIGGSTTDADTGGASGKGGSAGGGASAGFDGGRTGGASGEGGASNGGSGGPANDGGAVGGAGGSAGGAGGTAGGAGGTAGGAGGTAGGAGGGSAGGNSGTGGTAGPDGAAGTGGAAGAGVPDGSAGSGGTAGAGSGGRAGSGGVGGGTAGSAGGGSGGAGGSGGRGTPPAVVSVDFVGGGVAMGPAEVAGVVRAANWNSAAGPSGALASLVTSTGTATAAAVSWSGENVYQLEIPNTAGDLRMMNGYLDPFGTATVTVTGLPTTFTARGYNVYVYASGDVPASDMRSGTYTLGGTTLTARQAGNTPFSGTYTEAIGGGFGNYVVFRNLTTASFTLSATPGPATVTRRSPVNGLQIVALP